MSLWGRLRSTAGGDTSNPTITSAATVFIPDDTNIVVLSGTASVTSLQASPAARNRMVWFYSTSGTSTLTNTNDAATAGQMDLGGSNIALGATDMISLWLRPNGTWVRATPVADN